MKKLVLLISILLPIFALAQNNGDELNNIEITEYDENNTTVVARKSITIGPDFTTPINSEFLAFIDPDIPLYGGDPVPDGKFDLNYVRVYNPIQDWQSSSPPIHGSSIYNNWAENITYLNGLGMPIQKISVKSSSTGADIVQPIEYDDFGRQKKEFMSYTITQDNPIDGPGGYRQDAIGENKKFYSNYFGDDDGSFAFTESQFDGSPLSRIEKKSSPGYDWRLDEGGNIGFDYDLNISDELPRFVVDASGNLDHVGFYDPNTIYKTSTTDEEGNVSIEYKDQNGQVVCGRVGGLSTYYVFDDFGLLRYVISPKAFNLIKDNQSFLGNIFTNDIVKDLCYYYQYDARKRMTHKKLPGAAVIYMVYNQRNQLVLSQDGNLRDPDETLLSHWLFTKYDILDRPIITGKYTHSSEVSQSDMQAIVNGDEYTLFETFNGQSAYSADAFPIESFEIYTESYYDNYDILPDNDIRYGFVYDTMFIHLDDNMNRENIKGLPTVSFTKVVLNDNETVENAGLYSVIYYNKYGAPIQIITDNHMGGIDIVSSKVNFTGEVLKIKYEHSVLNENNSIVQYFKYNKSGQIIKEFNQINNSDFVVNINKYTELGQLSYKKLHTNSEGDNPLQKIDYKYNIKGWLTKINHPESLGDDLFAMQLDYNSDSPGSLLNGNISSMQWVSQHFSEIKQYNFSYDANNRLTDAKFVNNDTYTSHYDYDFNGNITDLSRKGLYNNTVGEIDDLGYSYGNTNQLKKVTDFADIGMKDLGFNENGVSEEQEYFYDANGNMYKDKNKGIDLITYNDLNLPTYIGIDQDQSKKINYIYTAKGGKLRKYTSDNGVTQTQIDYVGTFIYENNQLSFIQTSEGRLVPDGEEGFNYEYALKDHLGNTRVLLSQSGEVLQDQSYYPFGLSMGAELSFENNLSSPKNNYLYNSKELQMDFDLGWYDYGARFYDPALGRWHVIDPLSEKYYSNSPYNYVLNRPIIAIDPDGMRFKCYEIDESGMGNYGVKPDGYVHGPDANKAVSEMNKATSLTITRDSKTGKLSASGKAITAVDKMLNKSINDSNVDVHLTTTKDNSYTAKDNGEEYPLIVGAYEGSEIVNEYNLDGADGPGMMDDGSGSNTPKVKTRQLINMVQAEKIEKGGGAPMSESVVHEFVESYVGGVSDPGGNWTTGYNYSHNQTVKLTPHFDNSGKMVEFKGSVNGPVNGYGWQVKGSNKPVRLFNID